jgi:hypothetical protein
MLMLMMLCSSFSDSNTKGVITLAQFATKMDKESQMRNVSSVICIMVFAFLVTLTPLNIKHFSTSFKTRLYIYNILKAPVSTVVLHHIFTKETPILLPINQPSISHARVTILQKHPPPSTRSIDPIHPPRAPIPTLCAVPGTGGSVPNHRRPVPSAGEPRAPSPEPDRHPRCAARPHPEHPPQTLTPSPPIHKPDPARRSRNCRSQCARPVAAPLGTDGWTPRAPTLARYSPLNNLRAYLLPTTSVHGAGHSDPTALQISPSPI